MSGLAISVRDPYLTAILDGVKFHETRRRAWPWDRLSPGDRLWVHCPARFGGLDGTMEDLMVARFGARGVPGHVCGAVTIVGVFPSVDVEPEPWGFYGPSRTVISVMDAMWVEPFPVKGQLGLFRCEPPRQAP